MKVIPDSTAGGHKTGSLTRISKDEIDAALGFEPNVEDDADKVKYSWGFTADGVSCGIWDYKGSHRFNQYSTFGPDAVFQTLFGNRYTAGYVIPPAKV